MWEGTWEIKLRRGVGEKKKTTVMEFDHMFGLS
jgi:hypothetical protein